MNQVTTVFLYLSGETISSAGSRELGTAGQEAMWMLCGVCGNG